MQAQLYVALVASTIGFAAGGYFLKRYADASEMWDLAAAFSIFAVANLAYARVLAAGLSQGAVLAAMAHLIIMCVIGAAFFNERFGERQVLGLGIAILAAWVFSVQETSV